MTPEQFKRLDMLFAEGQQVPVSERAAWLDRACPDDPLVRAELAAMLEGENKVNSERTSDVLGGAIRLPTPQLPRPINLGEGFGPYKILGTIGEGGFGVVYLAEQTGAVRRRVALKVLKAGMDSAQVVARFDAERQALALMNHPNVAKVFDGGLTPPELGSRPYFAMEHVAGVPINEYCDAQKLSVRERLELMIHVCDAIQHAHQKGIIHRDIKPSNILVTLEERTEGGGGVPRQVPTPKVIDFGIAKAIARPLTDRTLYTEVGQLIGTPAYMSPEQAGTTGLDIDTRTDVYSLGVVLYELIVGALPFDPATLRAAGHNEILRIIREVDPPRPSTRLSSLGAQSTEVAARRRTVLDRLRSELRRELEWIPLKAMEKDRQRRYGSAADLARDIQNYLHNRPLLAGPPSRIYQARKFVRRNRGPVAAAAALTVALVAGVVGTSLGFASAIDQRNQAVAAGEREKKEKDNARAAEAEAQTQRAEAERQRDRAKREAYLGNIAAAEAALRDNDSGSVKQRLRAAPEELRGWEWNFLNAACDQSVGQLSGHILPIRNLYFSRNGEELVSNGWDQCKRWRLAAGEPSPLAWPGRRVERLACTEGTGVVFGFRFPDTYEVWDAQTGQTLWETQKQPLGQPFDLFAISRDASRIAYRVQTEGGIVIAEARTGRRLSPLLAPKQWIGALALSDDGRVLAVARESSVSVFDADGNPIAELEAGPGRLRAVGLSADGLMVAAGAEDGSIGAWSLPDGKRLVQHRAASEITSLTLSADGRLLGVGIKNALVSLFDARSGKKIDTLRGHTSPVTALEFRLDSRMLASGSQEGDLRLWDLDLGPATPTIDSAPLPWKNRVSRAVFTPDASAIVGVSGERATLWDPDKLTYLADLEHECTALAFEFCRDGRRAVSIVGTLTSLDKAAIWDMSTGRVERTLEAPFMKVESASISPDGRRVVLMYADYSMHIFDADSGLETGSRPRLDSRCYDTGFSPDGSLFVVNCGEGRVRVLDTTTWEVVATAGSGVLGSIGSVRFAPVGDGIAWGDADKSITLWNPRRSEPPRRLMGHSLRAGVAAFSPDGERVASTSQDRTLRLWSPAWNAETIALRGYEGLGSVPQSAAFSPDGTRLLVKTGDAVDSVRVWGTRTPAERRAALAARTAADDSATRWTDDQRRAGKDWAAVNRLARSDTSLAPSVAQAVLRLSLTKHLQERQDLRRRAAPVVDLLFQRLLLSADVITALTPEAVPDPDARAQAIRAAEVIGDDPDRLADQAATIGDDPEADAQRRAAALKVAQRIVSDHPNCLTYLSILGIAQYRAGMYEEAIATLGRFQALLSSPPTNGYSQPVEISVIAMAQHQLGRSEDSLKTLRRAQAAIRRPRHLWNKHESILIEAERMIEPAKSAVPQPQHPPAMSQSDGQ